jgi:hypothetical protein
VFLAPSFFSRLDRWKSTVRGLMPSVRAASLLEAPRILEPAQYALVESKCHVRVGGRLRPPEIGKRHEVQRFGFGAVHRLDGQPDVLDAVVDFHRDRLPDHHGPAFHRFPQCVAQVHAQAAPCRSDKLSARQSKRGFKVCLAFAVDDHMGRCELVQRPGVCDLAQMIVRNITT